jgi:hypothetical protein
MTRVGPGTPVALLDVGASPRVKDEVVALLKDGRRIKQP